MPFFITFEVESNRACVLRELTQRLVGVSEIAQGSTLGELMTAIEDAEIAACKAKHSAAVETLGGGHVQLVHRDV